MAIAPSKSRNISHKDPKELNLIPIMNLFIVVIPMLMTIMVSVHLAMIEITLPTKTSEGGGGGGEDQSKVEEDTPATITLALYPDRFEIKVEDVKNVVIIPALDTTTNPARYDFISLDEKINSLKQEHERQLTVEILPDPSVKFDTLLRSISICKENGFPNIKYLTATTKYFKSK